MDKEILKTQLASLTDKPGVYQYYDSNSKLLYVGKAKNLKKRVKSYFDKSLNPNPNNSYRIQKMISQVHSLHTVIVENEKEALILENFFIKSQNPKYNILLRDDKTYPYITIDLNDKYPRFSITRRLESKKNKLYFGPYPSGANEILKAIYEIFPLVQESSCIRGKRACLYHQINKCLGVCEFDNPQNKEKYENLIKEILALMQNIEKMKKLLEENMQHFADKELYEQALICKKCLNVIDEVGHFSSIDMRRLYDADILSFAYNSGIGVLLKLFVRGGKVISSTHSFVRVNDSKIATSEDFECEVYNQALLSMDSKNDIIIFPISKDNFESLCEFHTKLKLVLPIRGDKLKLAKLAALNATHILDNRMKNEDSDALVLRDIAELFDLKQDIFSIEVFDTSHHSGTHCVGGMISYIDSEFCKANYRHYNLSGSDEYSQMREMLKRRASSFDELSAPSLWLIDGGIAQINIALEILESSGANVEVLAISKEKISAKANRAKGRAKDILRSKNLEFRLDTRDKRLQLLQKLRDEAHRFAIGFHRYKKRKDIWIDE